MYKFCKCLWVSVFIIFIVPYCSAPLHKAGVYEHTQFAKARQLLAQRFIKCDNPEKRKAIAYTLKQYNCLGPFDVAVYHVSGCAGINAPWCPGITIDPEFFNNPEVLADLLLHEALHDYPPYFGHTQHERLEVW